MSSKEVILCRGMVDNNDTPNEYAKTFKSAGFTCKQLNVLNFEYSNLECLEDCLLEPNSYSGLIVTSRRAVEAITFALGDRCLPEQWSDSPIYCVGPATASFCQSALKLMNSLGEECGNSKDLANYIIDKRSEDKRPLLYPCSAIARDTIEHILGDAEIDVRKIVVYNTLPSKTLENDLSKIVTGSFQIFVFFSPSTVEYIVNAAHDRLDIIDKIQAVAIGPATAEALAKAKITVHAVSGKPEPKALLKAIESLVSPAVAVPDP